MSAQSGISASEELTAKFDDFLASDHRIAVLQIVEESCEFEQTVDKRGDLAQDLQALAKVLDPKDARYVAVKSEKDVVFVAFVPQVAPVRVKMKYASSTNSIYKQLGGSSRFSTIAFWTEAKEVSIEGWNEHIAHVDAEAPLTAEEESLKTAVEHEAHRMGTRQSNTGISALGVQAKVDEDGQQVLKRFSDTHDLNEIAVFSIAESGQIELVHSGPADQDALHTHFHENEPRYAVIKQEKEAVFVYVCPDDASVRNRMVYASTRIPFLNYVKCVVSIAGVLEVSERGEVTRQAVDSRIAPPEQPETVVAKPRFSRPKPPGRR